MVVDGPGGDEEALCDLATAADRVLMVGYTFLYNAGVRKMKEMMAPDAFGQPYYLHATRTNLVMTTNLRALIHMSGLRLCTMAQWEIRRLFQLIRHEIFAVSPFLGSFLAPKCVPLGYCDEFNNRDGHCPIRPHKDQVLEAWAEKAAAAKAAGRELPVA